MDRTMIIFLPISIFAILIIVKMVYYRKYRKNKIEVYEKDFKIKKRNKNDEQEIIKKINDINLIELRILDQIEEHKCTNIPLISIVSLCISALALINAVVKPIFDSNILQKENYILTSMNLFLVILLMLTIFFNISDNLFKEKAYKEIRVYLKSKLEDVRYDKNEMKSYLYSIMNKELKSNNTTNGKDKNLLKQLITIIGFILK